MKNKKFIFNKNNVCENPNEIVKVYLGLLSVKYGIHTKPCKFGA